MIKLFIVLGILLFPIMATADSDTAILNLTGNVPARVDVTLDNGELDLGEIGESDSTVSTNVITRANVPFNLSVESENEGKLVWDEAGEPAGDLTTEYGYTFTFDNSVVSLNEGSTFLIESGDRGREETLVEITTESLDSLLSDTESEMPTEGTYEDTLTFTIEAE